MLIYRGNLFRPNFWPRLERSLDPLALHLHHVYQRSQGYRAGANCGRLLGYRAIQDSAENTHRTFTDSPCLDPRPTHRRSSTKISRSVAFATSTCARSNSHKIHLMRSSVQYSLNSRCSTYVLPPASSRPLVNTQETYAGPTSVLVVADERVV
jgi:hypothetical protein